MSTNTITHINVAARDLDEHIGERFEFGEGRGVILSASVDANDSVEVSYLDEEGNTGEEWTAFAGDDEVTVFCARKLVDIDGETDEQAEERHDQADLVIVAQDLPDHVGRAFFYDDGRSGYSGTITAAEVWVIENVDRVTQIRYTDPRGEEMRAEPSWNQRVYLFDTPPF